MTKISLETNLKIKFLIKNHLEINILIVLMINLETNL